MAATSTAKKSSSKLAKMPIEDYDRLSVKAIVPRLTELSDRELQAVVTREKAGKNRVTLLQAVRKLELSREAGATRRAPATRELTIVEDLGSVDDLVDEDRVIESLGTAADLVIDDDDDFDIDEDVDINDELDLDDDPDIDDDPEIDEELDQDHGFGLMDDFDKAMRALEDEYENDAPVVTPPPVAKRGKKSPKSDPVPAVAAKSRSKGKAKAKSAPEAKAPVPEGDSKKSRPAVKAATWEEEVRPELPKRIAAAASAFELDYEPAPMSLVPPLTTENSAKPTTAAPRFARVIKLQKKFEGATLVMAAILAILLGLAIGTILARTGSVSAQPTPASVSTQSAPVTPGG